MEFRINNQTGIREITSSEFREQVKRGAGYYLLKQICNDDYDVEVLLSEMCNVSAKIAHINGVFNTVAKSYTLRFYDGSIEQAVVVPNYFDREGEPYIGLMDSVVILY